MARSSFQKLKLLHVRNYLLQNSDEEHPVTVHHYVASRTFELPELKLLVDSVQSSKFITHKKTASLIKKIETLASVHSAQLLHRFCGCRPPCPAPDRAPDRPVEGMKAHIGSVAALYDPQA